MTFVEWLRTQAKADRNKKPADLQAFSGLYAHGPYFKVSLGDDPPDPAAFKAHLLLEGFGPSEIEDLLRQLVIADATWRTDELSDHPETDSLDGVVDTARSSLLEPVEVKPAKCGFRDLDGTTCRAWAVDGAARCVDHGGAITDPHVRGSLLLLAYAQMTQGTAKAVDTLIDVMDHSKNDLARVQAAREMLDRAGLTAEQTITVTHANEATDTRDAVLSRIRSHLDTTRARLLPEGDDEIIDAEIVEPAESDPIEGAA